MKILIDMNLSPTWVLALQSGGHAAIHWSHVGDSQAKDREIFEWARRESAVILTHDLDFGTILALSRAHGPSVVQVRTQDITPESMSSVVLRILAEFQEELNKGALVSFDEASARMRLLPLLPESR